MTSIRTKEDFEAFVAEVEDRPFYKRPDAFGIAIVTYDCSGKQALDANFSVPNFDSNFGTAAVISHVLSSWSSDDRSDPYALNGSEIDEMLALFSPFENDGKKHKNIELLKSLRKSVFPVRTRFEVVFIDDLDASPRSVQDAYLRLHLLSHRFVKPNEINLDGIFGILPNVAWTSEGPIEIEALAERQLNARVKGKTLTVHSVDKFPRMTDYVVPSGVRIADASRVRLGAHLGEGTTVMHEGFVNFNAGTLGKSMVEGRVSAGVIVDEGSDIGGGASIMGTLSGGGKEKITIGKRCLIGANAGTGISLGDDCIIEAGCYVTAGSKIAGSFNGGAPEVIKASTLSGKSGILFRRNSVTGALEAVRNIKAVELNPTLHA